LNPSLKVEKSKRFSLLRNLAVAFGDGLLFGVAVKFVQESTRRREEPTTGLDRLAERLRKMEDQDRQAQTIDGEALMKPGEGFDRRVLDKVIVALEARLTEHVGHVERRIAEMDAQVAIDLKAVLNHAASQNGAFEKAVQQIEAEVRVSMEAAQRHGAEQVLGVDEKLTALQDALPAKFREIVDAVRQAMEARLALELQALAAPTQQALQQLEGKLTTLREEMPPKIRQIVEAVEAALDARMGAGDRVVASIAEEVRESMEGVAQLRAALGAVTVRLESGDQRAADQAASLDQRASQESALEHRLAILQEELPPKFKAIVDSVRQSIDARVAAELRTPVLEEGLAQVREALGVVTARLESDDQRMGALDRKLTLLHEELPPKFKAIVDAVREALDARVGAELQALEEQHRTQIQSMEARLASGIQALEARTLAGAAELEKALQYTSVLEARIQALEQKPQPSTDETVERAVERVWQSLESRLLQRTEPSLTPESIGELRLKSASAEQSVVDLIAGIGQIFEKPVAAPEPTNGTHAAHPPRPPQPLQDVVSETEEKPEVILLRPKESGRKWRIPFVSSSS
jgi:uncharacterized protein YktB (UPF0637 family)